MPVPAPLITTSPGRLSGTPVFAGTRVPVQTLVEYLEAGDSIDEIEKANVGKLDKKRLRERYGQAAA